MQKTLSLFFIAFLPLALMVVLFPPPKDTQLRSPSAITEEIRVNIGESFFVAHAYPLLKLPNSFLQDELNDWGELTAGDRKSYLNFKFTQYDQDHSNHKMSYFFPSDAEFVEPTK